MQYFSNLQYEFWVLDLWDSTRTLHKIFLEGSILWRNEFNSKQERRIDVTRFSTTQTRIRIFWFTVYTQY